MSQSVFPESVADLQPAARFVFRELRRSDDNRLSHSALRDRTGMSQKTLRRARTDLEEAGVAEGYRHPEDPRRGGVALAGEYRN